jgi:DNA-binding GntR family transcriptional regulator
MGHHFESVPTWAMALAEHQAVVEAIAAGDAQRAREAMYIHLKNSHDRYAGHWPAAAASPVPAGHGA